MDSTLRPSTPQLYAENVRFVAVISELSAPGLGRLATDAIGIAGEFTLSTHSGLWRMAASSR
jgi:hypothetical protein